MLPGDHSATEFLKLAQVGQVLEFCLDQLPPSFPCAALLPLMVLVLPEPSHHRYNHHWPPLWQGQLLQPLCHTPRAESGTVEPPARGAAKRALPALPRERELTPVFLSTRQPWGRSTAITQSGAATSTQQGCSGRGPILSSAFLCTTSLGLPPHPLIKTFHPCNFLG